MVANNIEREIPVLSFFSGAGFLDIGFLRTGKFCIPWHNECHQPFVDAYEYGISRLGYNTGSEKIQNRKRMENLKVEDIVQEAFKGGRKPKVFGVIGGPPCPDFSRAGKNNGYKGSNGVLTRHFTNMILKLRPTFFLLENVPGLLETKKHRAFLFSMLKRLGGCYAIDVRVLNALEYGVPQNRRRVFVVGICSKWLSLHSHRHGDILAKSNDIASIDVSGERTIADVDAELSKLHWFDWPRRRYPNAETVYSWHKRGNAPNQLKVGHQFKKINGHPNADDIFFPYSKKFEIIREGDASRKSFKRLSRYSYSPNAAYGNNEVHLHPVEGRRISVAEALTLQSVPKEYAFPSGITLTDKFKAISNGVPVLLAERMADSFSRFLCERVR